MTTKNPPPDDYAIVETMSKYGGSFVQALAALVRCADSDNLIRIKATWPEYWDQYRDLAILANQQQAKMKAHQ